MSPFGKWRTIKPVFIVMVEHVPVVTSPNSESENILSKNVGGASINLGSGFFSGSISSTITTVLAFLPALDAAAAAYFAASSFTAISSAVGGGGRTSIIFRWLRLASIVSTNNLLSLS